MRREQKLFSFWKVVGWWFFGSIRPWRSAFTFHHLFAVRFVWWIIVVGLCCLRSWGVVIKDFYPCCDLGLNITSRPVRVVLQEAAIRRSDRWSWWLKIEDELVSELHKCASTMAFVRKFLGILYYRGYKNKICCVRTSAVDGIVIIARASDFDQ